MSTPDLPGPFALTFPAHSSSAVVVRMVAATIASQAQFTVDRIDDLRLIADEFVSALITEVQPDAQIELSLSVGLHGDQPVVRMTGRVQTLRTVLPDESDLGWTVINALASQVTASLERDIFHLEIAVTEGGSRSAH